MNKVLVTVEEQTYVAPTKATVREYLTEEWLPAIEGDDPPLDLPLLRAARRVPHLPAHRQP